MVERDEVTNDNELRNFYLVEAFPAFTKLGYLAMETPKVSFIYLHYAFTKYLTVSTVIQKIRPCPNGLSTFGTVVSVLA